MLTTASYAVTRFYLERVGEAERVEELAARSVRLAKAGAAEGAEAEWRVLVAASVSPLGESYQAAALPAGEQRAQYAELIRGLKGCDVYARLSPLTSPPLSPRLPLTSPLTSSSRRYLCETMGTLAEGVLAASMCRAPSLAAFFTSSRVGFGSPLLGWAATPLTSTTTRYSPLCSTMSWAR